MKEIYILNDKKYFTTTKNKILVNPDIFLDNFELLVLGFRKIHFKKNIYNKTPKELIIRGNRFISFPSRLFLSDFPIEKIIIDSEFSNEREHFIDFNNAKVIELTNNANGTRLKEDIGIEGLEKIIIPFDITNCKFLRTNSKYIVVKKEETDHVIELDETLKNSNKDIYINKDKDNLIIKIISDNIDMEYKVYLENNELKSSKKYNKYEIDLNKNYIEELNIIELIDKYNVPIFINTCMHIKKITIDKNNLEYLLNSLFYYCDELEILDENEMSLFPRNINIKFNYKRNEYIKEKELINNTLFIKTNEKYIIVTQDLHLIEIKHEPKSIILDFDNNKFKYENNILTIPFNKESKIIHSKILIDLINKFETITILKNNKIYQFDTKKIFEVNKEDIGENNKNIFNTIKKGTKLIKKF